MDPRHLEARLDRLERRNRTLTLLLAAAGLALATTSFGGQDDVLRARGVELVDAEGRARAELALDADGSAGLFVRDAEGRVRASVTHDDEATALFLRDTKGQVRLGAAQFAHGGGGYALHGPGGSPTTVLYQKEAGSLTFFDADGVIVERFPE